MFWVLDRSKQSLDDNSVYGTFIAYQDDEIWESSLCSVCGRSKSRKQVNNLGVVLYGTMLLDFVWLDTPSVIISSSLKNKLSKSDLKGFDFRDIEIVGWLDKGIEHGTNNDKSNNQSDLFQLVVKGKGGSLRPQNEMVIKSNCDICEITSYEPLENGMIVDRSQWDKSDIFYMDEFPGWILINDKFLKFLVDNNINGYDIADVKDFSMVNY